MSREVMRVPLDFDWPLKEIWKGYLTPAELSGDTCIPCLGTGMTHTGWWVDKFAYLMAMLAADVHEQQWGNSMHRWLREMPMRHSHLEYRLNGAWVPSAMIGREDREHLNLRSVEGREVIDRPTEDALAFFHGLMTTHYTERFAQDDEYAYLYDPAKLPPVEKVASSMGSSSGGTGQRNAQDALIEVLKKASGVDFVCPVCDGHGEQEQYEGQRAERKAWQPYAPPKGEGWQLWERVSEGSPISPVFAWPEDLARWLTTWDACWGAMEQPMEYGAALRFVQAGWAPSMVSSTTSSGQVELVNGPEWIGREQEGDSTS